MGTILELADPKPARSTSRRLLWIFTIIVLSALLLLGSHFYKVTIYIQPRSIPSGIQQAPPVQSYPCKPSLPSLLRNSPPIFRNEPSLQLAAATLDLQLLARTSKSDIDSLVLAVVTPSGILWSKGYGKQHANETESAPPDLDTIYRLASISKMFATLETIILREKGALSWDDPVEKFLPNFTYQAHGWKEYRKNETFVPTKQNNPITLRQLASHMSGIGRDYPPLDWKPWPDNPEVDGTELFIPLRTSQVEPPPEPVFPTIPEVMDAIAKYPLVAPSYSYPIYSNTGYSLLGWCNVAAAKAADRGAPGTYAELLETDIFKPLDMKGSTFLASTRNRNHLAFASFGSEVDLDFTESQNAAGGQFSSARDLANVMQMFLDPGREGSIISPYAMREWLRPMHAWSDELTEVGATWEIIKFDGSNGGGKQRYYQKGGNLASFHTEFSFNPALSFGVIALMTGVYADTAHFTNLAIQQFQPAFSDILVRNVRRYYAGRWKGDDGEVILEYTGGSLRILKMVIKGKDVLQAFQTGPHKVSSPLSLWSTEREDEFRLAFGRPWLNSEPLAGCEPYWVSIDSLNSHGAPVDLIYFEGERKDRVLIYPAMEVALRKH